MNMYFCLRNTLLYYMKKAKLLTASLLMAGLACGEAAAQTPEEVHRDFFGRFAAWPKEADPLPTVCRQPSPELRQALEFLYAYMAWPDLADYPADFYLRQADYALRTRREMPWGKNVPDREWLHFVLPPRVNNENLDTFRTACYEELKRRVEGLSMREAVLEVNHWCHEHVTYKPSDSRTSSPLASMRTATGRCGEESTFTVAALRTVGIPARQVYTPRWAHTDDNHAWVEAWVDGEWCFLGACEPEPVLNLGWFNQPASRGMLMHTKVFGRYDGPEDVMSRTPCYTEINVTANYAPVAACAVRVVDGQGKAVPGARVEFKLYNYAELYTVMRTQADSEGRASITAGLGDLVAWASDGGRYGFAKLSVGKDKEVELRLSHRPGEVCFSEMDIVPPAGRDNLPKVSRKTARDNALRTLREDSIRTAYVQTFPDSARIWQFARDEGLDFRRLRPLAKKSRGNYESLFSTLKAHKEPFVFDLLESLSEKDLRDFDPGVLADHIDALSAAMPDSAAFDPAVGCPRIANEMLTPWRGYFKKAFPERQQEAFRKAPAELARWVADSVATDGEWNPMQLCLSPESAHRLRRADLRSKGLLFVAAARSMGIPARIDEVTGQVQYRADGAWQTVGLEKDAAPVREASRETLSLAYTPREFMEDPRYYSHFTLSRMEDGMPVLQNYGEEDSWQSVFKEGTPVDAGNYLLTSGTRMADGSVLATLSLFPVTRNAGTEVPLRMREDKGKVQVIGSFNSESRYLGWPDKIERSVLSTTGRGYFVVGLIRANHEPSNHVLHDLEKQARELEAWGRTILLLFPSEEEAARFEERRSEFSALPANVCFGVDESGEVAHDLLGGNLAKSEELPLVIIGDTFNRVVFASQGYTIGIGERIKNTVGKL